MSSISGVSNFSCSMVNSSPNWKEREKYSADYLWKAYRHHTDTIITLFNIRNHLEPCYQRHISFPPRKKKIKKGKDKSMNNESVLLRSIKVKLLTTIIQLIDHYLLTIFHQQTLKLIPLLMFKKFTLVKLLGTMIFKEKDMQYHWHD